jgi:hypothetical protein
VGLPIVDQFNRGGNCKFQGGLIIFLLENLAWAYSIKEGIVNYNSLKQFPIVVFTEQRTDTQTHPIQLFKLLLNPLKWPLSPGLSWL